MLVLFILVVSNISFVVGSTVDNSGQEYLILYTNGETAGQQELQLYVGNVANDTATVSVSAPGTQGGFVIIISLATNTCQPPSLHQGYI